MVYEACKADLYEKNNVQLQSIYILPVSYINHDSSRVKIYMRFVLSIDGHQVLTFKEKANWALQVCKTQRHECHKIEVQKRH